MQMPLRLGGGSRTDLGRVTWELAHPSYELVAADTDSSTGFYSRISELDRLLEERGETQDFRYTVRKPVLGGMLARVPDGGRHAGATLGGVADALEENDVTTKNVYTLWRTGKDLLKLHGHAGEGTDTRVAYTGHIHTSLPDRELGNYVSLQD